MRTYEELLEILGEAELTSISMEFWMNYCELLDKLSNDPKAYQDLLAFQNGWLACKDFYKIRG